MGSTESIARKRKQQSRNSKAVHVDCVVRKVLLRERYARLYARSDAMNAEGRDPLNANERRAMQLLEDDMPVDDTLAFRRYAAARVKARARKSAASEEGGVASWISSWWGSSEAPLGEQNQQLTAEEKEEILAAASYLDASRTRNIPPGTVMTQILTTLEITVAIIDDHGANVSILCAEGSYDVRTLVSGAYQLNAKLSSLGLTVPSGDARRTVVEPLRSSQNLVNVDISLDPTGEASAVSEHKDHIRVKAEHFRIVLYPEWMSRLIDFFSIEDLPSSFSLEAFKDWGDAKRKDIVLAILKDSRQAQRMIQIAIDIAAPTLVFPVQESFSRVHLVANLGRMLIERGDKDSFYNTEGCFEERAACASTRMSSSTKR